MRTTVLPAGAVHPVDEDLGEQRVRRADDAVAARPVDLDEAPVHEPLHQLGSTAEREQVGWSIGSATATSSAAARSSGARSSIRSASSSTRRGLEPGRVVLHPRAVPQPEAAIGEPGVDELAQHQQVAGAALVQAARRARLDRRAERRLEHRGGLRRVERLEVVAHEEAVLPQRGDRAGSAPSWRRRVITAFACRW